MLCASFNKKHFLPSRVYTLAVQTVQNKDVSLLNLSSCVYFSCYDLGVLVAFWCFLFGFFLVFFFLVGLFLS